MTEACARAAARLDTNLTMPQQLCAHEDLNTASRLLTSRELAGRCVPPMPTTDATGATGPSVEAIRQLPPRLREWIRRNLLHGRPAAEALQSPLTFTSGIFDGLPYIHAACCKPRDRVQWASRWDLIDDPTWATTPWRSDVMVTVEETYRNELDGLMQKVLVTRRAGFRVVLVIASRWRSAAELNVGTLRCLMQLHAGSVPWGEATGWPVRDGQNGGSGGGAATWCMREGIPWAGETETAASLPRSPAMGNGTAVFVVLAASHQHVVDYAAVDELTHILLGVGLAPRDDTSTPVWYPNGCASSCRRLVPRNMRESEGGEDPLRPLRVCAWQPLRAPGEELPEDATALPEEARAAATALRRLSSCIRRGEAFDARLAMPDGVVPSQLPIFLRAIGVRAGDVCRAITRIMTAQCSATHWAEMARARSLASHLCQLGVYAPTLTGVSNLRHAFCAACGHPATRLVHVVTDKSAECNKLLWKILDRQELEYKQRLPEAAAEAATEALHNEMRTAGAIACLACAAKAITRKTVDHEASMGQRPAMVADVEHTIDPPAFGVRLFFPFPPRSPPLISALSPLCHRAGF